MMVVQMAEEEKKQKGATAVAHSVKEVRPSVTATHGFAASRQ